MNCKKCGNPIPNNQNFCKICETIQDESLAAIKQQETIGFLKFITHFLLPVHILGGLINGILYTFGILRNFDYTATAYAEWGSTYETVPFLKALDIPMGLCYFGLAAFGIVAMVLLLHRKKNAPDCFFAMFLSSIVVTLAFRFINYAIQLSIGEQTDYTAPSGYQFYAILILTLAIQCGFLWVSNRYFKKREKLFDQ